MLLRESAALPILLAHAGGSGAGADGRGDDPSYRGVLLAADLTRRYTEEDLRRCDDLIAAIRDRIAVMGASLDGLEALDDLIETLALFEAERLRIVNALTK